MYMNLLILITALGSVGMFATDVTWFAKRYTRK